MAKQKTTQSKKEFNIDAFTSYLKKDVNPAGDLISNFSRPRSFISTGIYVLDAALSGRLIGGGVPDDKVSGFGGESGTGKSFILLNIARNAQKDGYFVFYIDTEGAVDLELIENFGIDPKRFRREPIKTVEQLRMYISNFVDKLSKAKEAGEELPKIILFIDSLGNSASKKETEDAISGENKADMTRAKTLKSLFRIVTSTLEELKIPMVLSNHTYFTQEMYPREVFSGGGGAVFNCSTIQMLSKAKDKDGDDSQMDELDTNNGFIVTAKGFKNRMAKPKKVKFALSPNSGANKFRGLEHWLTMKNYNQIGIVKGKKTVDKDTGEIKIVETGHYWYVRHLDKAVTKKQLFTSIVFTKEVLEAMAPIVNEYFRYKSVDELERIAFELDGMQESMDEPVDADNIDASELFS